MTVPLPPDATWSGESSGNTAVLTTRHLFPKLIGKVNTVCVRSAMDMMMMMIPMLKFLHQILSLQSNDGVPSSNTQSPGSNVRVSS